MSAPYVLTLSNVESKGEPVHVRSDDLPAVGDHLVLSNVHWLVDEVFVDPEQTNPEGKTPLVEVAVRYGFQARQHIVRELWQT